MNRCEYDPKRCQQPAVAIAHDTRGCRKVCVVHADFLRRTSMGLGHSKDCPRPDRPFKRITPLESE